MVAGNFSIFCGGAFWNDSLIKRGSWPQMTDCFIDTVLNWVPTGYLLLMMPYYVMSAKEMKGIGGSYKVTLINGSKLFCCTLLATLSLVQLLLRSQEVEMSDSMAAYLGSALRLVTYIVLGLMTQYERLKGARSLAVPFYFWLLRVVCDIVPLYTLIQEKMYETSVANFAVFVMLFVLQLFCLGLTGFTDRQGESKHLTNGRTPCPMTLCSYPSFLLFGWMTRLMVTGYRRDLEENDLWSLPTQEQSDQLVPRFDQLWRQEEARCRKTNTGNSSKRAIAASTSPSANRTSAMNYETCGMNGWRPPRAESTVHSEKTPFFTSTRFVADKDQKQKEAKPRLFFVLAKMFFKDFFFSFVQKVGSDLIFLCCPLLMRLIIEHHGEGDLAWQGYVLSLALFCALVVKSLLFTHSMFGAKRIAVRMKSTLVAAIYHKALTMNTASKNNCTTGEVMNLMSVDAQRIVDLMNISHFALTAPIQIVVTIVLLYYTIGPSSFAGIGYILFALVLNSYVMMKQNDLQKNNLTHKDDRIRLYDEVLKGIKVLKLYAWEPSFREKIREIRLKEVATLFSMAVLNTLMSLCWDLAPYMVTLVTFSAYVLWDPDNVLDASQAFVTLSFLHILRSPLFLMSLVSVTLVQAMVSGRRINAFLLGSDLDPTAACHDSSTREVILVEEGVFTWDRNLPPTLSNVNLEVGEGKLVAVVGPVGSGKSSLINALLGEMEKLHGTVNTRGRIAYVPQQAWIQNATVRDNVLFGQAFSPTRYRAVLKQCQLQSDLDILPAGDETEIGEKGINLSGGQKQRVSLARAVYSDSDLYLLDDPLSAVDSHVGKAIFTKVIGPNSVLRKKTRVLVTHGVHWLPMVDKVIVMHDGKVSERGSYEELMSHDGPFAQFLKTYLTELHLSDDEEDIEMTETYQRMARRLDSLTSDGVSSGDDFSGNRRIKQRRTKRKPSTQPEGTVASIAPVKEAEITAQVVGRLTTVETIEKGKVNTEIFKTYGRAAGPVALGMAFFSFCVFQSLSVGTNFWLNVWTKDAELFNVSDTGQTSVREQNNFYLGIYGLFGLVQVVFLAIFNYLFWTRMATAARLIQSRLADSILRAPMAFFDTTPVGRILNRVSRDVEIVDNKLPSVSRELLVMFTSMVVTLLVIIILAPFSSLLVLPAVLLYYLCQGFYVPTARQLARIESVTRSPIFVLFSETMSGAASVRSYQATDRFLRDSRVRVDRNQVYVFAGQAAVRWLNLNLDLLTAVIVLASCIFSLLSDADASDLGMSITYSLQISGILSWMTRQISEFETSIVSVERIKEYSELKPEADWILPDRRPAPSWPQTGEVTFDNYRTRYREGLDLVLNGVSCVFKDGEKVGIVGRTGAGKSSLALSLFRLIEATGGRILIDGVNIADMGLHDLRSHLTILPQDPVLFSGSLRMNLDPFDEYSDDQLWTALDRAHLREAVQALPGHLDFLCGEEGGNLSVGQRQLLCLARTLLRRTKILVLDEATAAVDMETDALIQSTIRTSFSHCTVITIAHRLNTIMDYDKIVVMDGGLVKELAPPDDLLADRSSTFFAMARDAGLVL